MNIRLILAAAVLSTTVTPAPAAPVNQVDEPVLTALAREADEAWNSADAAAMTRFYSADGTLRLGTMDRPVRGQQQLLAHFARVFAARPQGLRHVTEVQQLEMLTPDTALAESLVRLERQDAGGSWRPLQQFLNTTVVVRQNGAWKFAAVRAYALPLTTSSK